MTNKYHYVYCTHNLINGKEYIGKHSTNDLNDGYYGSGKMLKCAVAKYGLENFAVEILSFHDTEEEACNEEARIVDEDYIDREDTYNILLGGLGNFTGMTTVTDTEGNTFCAPITHPKFISGEWVGILKGKVIVKDKDGNQFAVSKEDPRYVSGELISTTTGKLKPGHNKGRVLVKDGAGNTYSVYKDDPRYLSGELVGIMKGRKIKHPKLTCPHCRKIGQPSNMYRWHFDNCKLNPLRPQ